MAATHMTPTHTAVPAGVAVVVVRDGLFLAGPRTSVLVLTH